MRVQKECSRSAEMIGAMRVQKECSRSCSAEMIGVQCMCRRNAAAAGMQR